MSDNSKYRTPKDVRKNPLTQESDERQLEENQNSCFKQPSYPLLGLKNIGVKIGKGNNNSSNSDERGISHHSSHNLSSLLNVGIGSRD